jgi:predicted dehydrogenase
VRFGILGTGYWAEHCHAAGLASHPEVELVGVWGRDAAKARAFADRLKISAETDLDALLSKVDAVAIAVPPVVQAELVCRAAAAGCHLLLEKPLAQDVGAAERAVAAIEKAGVYSVTLFTMLFQLPTAQWLKELSASGGWHGSSITWLSAPPPPDSPFVNSPWRNEEFGRLWDGGPHWLAVVISVLGPVATVTARGGAGSAIQLTATHEGGGLSSILFDFNLPAGSKHCSEMRFWGKNGIGNPPASPSFSPAPEFMKAAVSALLSACKDKRPHPYDARFALHIVRVLADCERQLRMNR